ncbi:ricin B lectin (RBL4c) [Vairimorpha necatrix]|uniref:Ricin B lectin (RBL4c) n=1 Tax=Vairimorpha necatrix TaxID=6039 RepID=A0AAX4J7V0_9MICR
MNTLIIHLLLLTFIHSNLVSFTNKKSGLSLCCKNRINIYGCSEKEDTIQALINHEEGGKISIEVPKHNNYVFYPIESPQILSLWQNQAGIDNEIDIVLYKDEDYMIMKNGKCFGYNEKDNNFVESECFDSGSMFNIKFENDEKDEIENETYKEEEEGQSDVVEEYRPKKHKHSCSHKKRHYIPMDN